MLGVLLWLRNPYSHPVTWVASIKRGSTRAASTFLAGLSVHPTWIGAT